MKSILSLALVLASTAALAHPAGTYVINGDRKVTLTIQRIGVCPAAAGALSGTLRTFSFSNTAKAHPYAFVSGHYVEIHEGTKEVYVQVNESCVPKSRGKRYAASHETFDVYSLQKI